MNEWRKVFDEKGETYYWNILTNETTWSKPENFTDSEAVKTIDLNGPADATELNDISFVAPTSLRFDWGTRQMNHFFNVDEFVKKKQAEKEPQRKLTKREIEDFKRRKKEKQKKKQEWLYK